MKKTNEVKTNLTPADMILIENSNRLYKNIEKKLSLKCIDPNACPGFENYQRFLVGSTLTDIYCASLEIEGEDYMVPISLSEIEKNEGVQILKLDMGTGLYGVSISKQEVNENRKVKALSI